MDDEGVGELRADHPGDEVHALQHHRPSLGERTLDGGLDADEHVPRLIEEAEERGVA